MAGVLRAAGMSPLALSLLVLLLLVGHARAARGVAEERAAGDERRCGDAVTAWTEAQQLALAALPRNSALDRLKLRDLLFFLHVPRTGGRTFHQCFLKHLFASDERCPRSYDKLRIDRSQPGCRLISTHDDYSLLEKLSHESTSVVTALRPPVDRVLSSYEFSIEVAARSLRQLRLQSAPKKGLPLLPPPAAASPPASGKTSKIMSTLEIWPWKYLVPTMEADIFARRTARKQASAAAGPAGSAAARSNSSSAVPTLDSYDAPAVVMPLLDFVRHPVAGELVHNGATFQVAGLTNTSYSEDARRVRSCVVRFPALGKHVVEVAKGRLDRMLYVGLTDRQKDAALFFAKVVGEQVSMELFLRSMMTQKRQRRRPVQHKGRPVESKIPLNFTRVEDLREEDVIEELMSSYDACVEDLRKVQENRRSMSLQSVSPVKFSRGARGMIPDRVIAELVRRNGLDIELFAHAEKIFARQQNFLRHGDFHFNEEKEPVKERGDDGFAEDGGGGGGEEGAVNHKSEYEHLWDSFRAISFVTFSIPSASLVLLVVVIYLVTKRQGARVKET